MPDQSQEIYVVILLGVGLALLLVGFIGAMLFLYQRRQHRQDRSTRQPRVRRRRRVTGLQPLDPSPKPCGLPLKKPFDLRNLSPHS